MLVGFNVLFYVGLFSLAPNVQLSDAFCSERHKLYQEDKADVLAPCISGLLAYNQNIYLAAGQQRLVYRYEGLVPHATGRLIPVEPAYYIDYAPQEEDQALFDSIAEPSKSSQSPKVSESTQIVVSSELSTQQVLSGKEVPQTQQQANRTESASTLSVALNSSPKLKASQPNAADYRQWQFVEKQGAKIISYLWIEKKACVKDDIDFVLTLTFKINEQTVYGCGHILQDPAGT